MKRLKILIAIPSNTGRASLPFPMVRSLIMMIQYTNKHNPEVDIDMRYFSGLRIDAVRNHMIEFARNEKFDKILFLDDDMIFSDESTISKLLAHNKPIVSGLYGSKSYPFHYFVIPIEQEGMNWLTEVEQKTYQVKTLATGCLLIDLSIFDKLSRPYFLLRMDMFGRITTTEDCYFGLSCTKVGIEMYVDATLQCQHLRLVAFPQFWKNPFMHYDDPKDLGFKATDKIIQVHPQSGFLWSDGIDKCKHVDQVEMIVNEGEDPHYQCVNCGLISKGLKVEDMERISNENH